jgi:hypothetical protein
VSVDVRPKRPRSPQEATSSAAQATTIMRQPAIYEKPKTTTGTGDETASEGKDTKRSRDKPPSTSAGPPQRYHVDEDQVEAGKKTWQDFQSRRRR